MSVNITLALEAAVEQDLRAKAQQLGLTLEALVTELVSGELAAPAVDGLKQAEAFAAWARGHRRTKLLSDEAVSRAGMYSDHG